MIVFTIFIFSIYSLKIALSSYLFFYTHSQFYLKNALQPLLTRFRTYQSLIAKFIFIFELLLVHVRTKTLTWSIRMTKAPYADAYWFLYSSKMTYVTQRSLPL